MNFPDFYGEIFIIAEKSLQQKIEKSHCIALEKIFLASIESKQKDDSPFAEFEAAPQLAFIQRRLRSEIRRCR